MARGYRKVDRDQSFLVPPDMRDWLPEKHLVWFVIDAVEQLDLVSLHAASKRGGVGRQGYDPGVLLGLWIYASARGVTSSRQIERACHEDIAFRILCSQDVPDHTVLARFRQTHESAMADLFAQVLALCVNAGLGDFGVVAIDGTKIAANASKDQTFTLATLRKLAAAELTKAAATDAAEDARDAPTIDDEVPPSLGPGSDRPARIRRALASAQAVVDAESGKGVEDAQQAVEAAERRLAAANAAGQALLARHAAAAEAGKRIHGRPATGRGQEIAKAEAVRVTAQRRHAEALEKARRQTDGVSGGGFRLAARNITDPDSRVMKTRNGFIQAFNAQLAVTNDGLILTATMTDIPTDTTQLAPVMDDAVAAAEALGKTIGVVVADNGYLTQTAIDHPGPKRVIAPGRGKATDSGWTGSRRSSNPAAAKAMAELLEDPDNQAAYRRRSLTVEPVNGHLKDRRGLRQLARRGLTAVQAELHLAALTSNLLKLHKKAHAT